MYGRAVYRGFELVIGGQAAHDGATRAALVVLVMLSMHGVYMEHTVCTRVNQKVGTHSPTCIK